MSLLLCLNETQLEITRVDWSLYNEGLQLTKIFHLMKSTASLLGPCFLENPPCLMNFCGEAYEEILED